MASRPVRSTPLAAFVLHRYDWSESSLVLDLFSRDQGRIAVVARGAKRPFSQLRSVLLPFQRLAVSLGRAPNGEETREIHNLRGADWAGGAPMLTGAALFSGFYLNELLLRLLARHDPHPALFDAYATTLLSLGAARDDDAAAQAALRAFELTLLKEIGLLPDLHIETPSRQPVDPARRYVVLADAGVVEAKNVDSESGLSGAALVALQDALEGDGLPALQQGAQLHYHLGSDQLRTRRVMLDAQALER